MRIAVIFTAHTLWRATLFPRILLKIRADKQKKKKKHPSFPSFLLLLFLSLFLLLVTRQGGAVCPPPVGTLLPASVENLAERGREGGGGGGDSWTLVFNIGLGVHEILRYPGKKGNLTELSPRFARILPEIFARILTSAFWGGGGGAQ